MEFKSELITLEEMIRAKMDEGFRKKLILDNEEIIWQIIQQRVPGAKQSSRNVLFQEGVIGFVEAVTSFDPDKVNTKPHSHIYTCIRNRFRKVFIKSIKNGLKFSDKMLYYVNRHNGKRIEFKTKKGKWVGFSEIKSLKELVLIAKGKHWTPKNDFDSTEQTIPGSKAGSKEMTIGDTLKSEGKDALGQIEETEAIEMFSKYLEEHGTERQKKIVELSFGMKDGVPKSLRQIAPVVGCSRETINRELNKVMDRFKSYYGRRVELT